MRKKLIIMGMIFLLIILNAVGSYASGTTVQLQADKAEVKVGETFTVTLKATCEEGINGIDTTYTYDTDKLELVSANVASSDFSSLGVDNQITVICNSATSITSADIYVLTFKVKDGVTANSTAKISIAETLLDSDSATDSENTIAAQEISVTIVEEETGDPNPPVTPPAEEPEEPETPVTPPAEQPTTPGMTVTVSGGNKTDTTVSDKVLPKTGVSLIIVIAIVSAVIIAIVLYKKYKDYQFIK